MCEIAMFLLGAFVVGYFRKDTIVDEVDRDEIVEDRPAPAVRRRTTTKRRRA